MTLSNKQYLNIRNQLVASLRAEHYRAHDKLPSERQLSETYECTRATAREALMQMEAEGLIYRMNRRGWFVTPPRIIFTPALKQSFMQMVKEQNRRGATRVLAAAIVNSPINVSRQLGLAPGDKVVEIKRVRSLEDRPVLHETVYFSAQRFPDMLTQALDGSLTELLCERYQQVIEQEQINITSATINPQATDELQVLPGRSGVCIKRLRMNTAAEPVEVDIEYWLSDSIEVLVDAT